MAKHLKQSFNRQEVILDNNRFEDCTFVDCTMVYSGEGPVLLIRPTIENCRWRFDKSASRTLEFLKGLRRIGHAAVIDESFKELNRSSAIKVF